MELIMSRRLWVGVIVGLALGFVLSTLFVPWAGLLVQPTHGHEGSPAYADNGRDVSYLMPNGDRVDRFIQICDHSSNGDKALGRAFDNGSVVQTVVDQDGAGGDCWGQVIGQNAAAHDACVGHSPAFGCGPNSGHGT